MKGICDGCGEEKEVEACDGAPLAGGAICDDCKQPADNVAISPQELDAIKAKAKGANYSTGVYGPTVVALVAYTRKVIAQRDRLLGASEWYLSQQELGRVEAIVGAEDDLRAAIAEASDGSNP